jgi:hypothetical protein
LFGLGLGHDVLGRDWSRLRYTGATCSETLFNFLSRVWIKSMAGSKKRKRGQIEQADVSEDSDGDGEYPVGMLLFSKLTRCPHGGSSEAILGVRLVDKPKVQFVCFYFNVHGAFLIVSVGVFYQGTLSFWSLDSLV